MPPFLALEHLEKRFGDHPVLEDLSLELAEGEVLALLGLSGSGKTTALRLLAGFESPDRGRILLEGRDVAPLGPAARGFGMVFQHYALFPQMTVAENVAFGLEARGAGKDEVMRRVAEMLALVDLAAFGGRKVSEISGGQQQRVALARALAPAPKLLLLDEPLSNLDPALRERTRAELRAAVKKIGITTVLVTHEQEEAFHVGDRVAVLHHGRLQQVGTPLELYREPRSRFVAGFVGRSSILPGRVVRVDGELAEAAIEGAAGPRGGAGIWRGRAALGAGSLAEGQQVDVYVRPESLQIGDDGPALEAEVRELRFTGPATYAVAEAQGGRRLEVAIGLDQDVVGRRVQVGPRVEGPLPTFFAAGDERA
jgi:ABC-type Fe3+/spermidine/putrescine transport system ATPase subunit